MAKGEKKPKKKAKPKRKRAGRKDSITVARVRVLVKAVGCGLPKCHAASLAKITHRTLCNWLNWGEEALAEAGEDESRVPAVRRLHVQLFLGIRKAVADTMKDALDNIAEAGEKNWQASAWLLSRLSPNRFADQRLQYMELKRTCAELAAEVQRLRNLPPLPRNDVPQSDADARAGEAVVLPGSVPPKPEDVPTVNVVAPVIGESYPVGL